jgi:hypothetical protein
MTPTTELKTCESDLSPDIIRDIIREYDGKEAAEVLRAIRGTPEQDVENHPEPLNIAGCAAWLAIGAAAVAWILTHP